MSVFNCILGSRQVIFEKRCVKNIGCSEGKLIEMVFFDAEVSVSYLYDWLRISYECG